MSAMMIGESAGLKYTALRIFTQFVEAHLPDGDPESVKEWARWFVGGSAYARSNVVGRLLLADLASELCETQEEADSWIQLQGA